MDATTKAQFDAMAARVTALEQRVEAMDKLSASTVETTTLSVRLRSVEHSLAGLDARASDVSTTPEAE